MSNIVSNNMSQKMQRRHRDLILPRNSNIDVAYELSSTHRADFKAYRPSPAKDSGKKRQLMNNFLFQKISEDVAREEFRPGSPPNYISTTHDDFNVPGFDPDANLKPKFEYSLYLDPLITYWSENKRRVHGITVPDNPTRNFNSSSTFTKPVWDQWEELTETNP